MREDAVSHAGLSAGQPGSTGDVGGIGSGLTRRPVPQTGRAGSALVVREGSDADRALYIIALAGIVATLIIVDLLLAPSRFSDYDTYLFYLDGIWYFPDGTSLWVEPLSRLFLLGARAATTTSDGAVALAHYALAAIFAGGLALLAPPKRGNWQAALVAFAITGPLLALVTVRATPAYLLVALAVIQADRRPSRSALLMGLALLFHVSAALAVGPWLLLLLRRHLPVAVRAERPGPLVAAGIIAAIAFYYFGQLAVSVMLSAVDAFPALSKYVAYSAEYGPQTKIAQEISISHYIFLTFAVSYTGAFLVFRTPESVRFNLYVIASFLIYITLFFALSPVAAFRQACFYLLPMTVLFPWRRVGVVAPLAPLFMLATLGFFTFQLSQVYQ